MLQPPKGIVVFWPMSRERDISPYQPLWWVIRTAPQAFTPLLGICGRVWPIQCLCISQSLSFGSRLRDPGRVQRERVTCLLQPKGDNPVFLTARQTVPTSDSGEGGSKRYPPPLTSWPLLQLGQWKQGFAPPRAHPREPAPRSGHCAH